MSRFKVGLLLMMVMMLVVACGGDDGGDDSEGDSQSNSVGDVTIVWEVTGNNSDFGDRMRIRLGELWLAGDTVMIGRVELGDGNGYQLRYSAEDGSALEPLDFIVLRDNISDEGGLILDDVFYDESDGTYWGVTSMQGAPIIHFTEDSEVLGEYGVRPALGAEEQEGQLRGLTDIFIGSDDHIYVHESRNLNVPQITALTRDGEFVREFNYELVEDVQYGMSVGASDEIIITPLNRTLATHGFDVYDLEGNVLRDNFAIDIAIEETLRTTSALATKTQIDAEGNTVFASWFYIYRLDPEGEITHAYDALLQLNEEADVPPTSMRSDGYLWDSIVLLPNGDVVGLYSNPETWTLVRLAFG